MNEAQKILRRQMELEQSCIKQIETSIGLQQESLKVRKKSLKEIIDALMVLESEKG